MFKTEINKNRLSADKRKDYPEGNNQLVRCTPTNLKISY